MPVSAGSLLAASLDSILEQRTTMNATLHA